MKEQTIVEQAENFVTEDVTTDVIEETGKAGLSFGKKVLIVVGGVLVWKKVIKPGFNWAKNKIEDRKAKKEEAKKAKVEQAEVIEVVEEVE